MSDGLRVLFNTHPSAFFVPGGGEVQLRETRDHLAKQGVRVDLFDMWQPDVERYDLVHMFSAFGGALPFHEHVRARGVPLVLSPILWLGGDVTPFPMEEIRGLFATADRVLPNSRAELEAFARHYDFPRDRYRVVPNGIRVAPPGPGPEPFRRHADAREFVLCVGNVEPRKNQLALSQACRLLGRDLLLVGAARDDAYRDACLREGGGHVRHLEPLEHDGPLLASAYQACSVHVLASHFETPGLATLEAAAQGARLVSTRHGSAVEYLGDLAEYVDTDPEDIAAGIARALARAHDPEALRRHVIEGFGWDRTASILIDVYREVLDGR